MTKQPADELIEKSLYQILVDRIPAIKNDLVGFDNKSCAFKVAAFFAGYAKKQISEKNYVELEKCFQVADEVARLSPGESKTAIENIFLFALLRQLSSNVIALSLLPAYLKKAYRRLSVT